MAEQPKYFDIEDYGTGKRYRVEAYEPDVTFDEAVQFLSTVPDEELSQYEYNPEPVAAAPQARQTTAAPSPAPQAEQPKEPRKETPWTRSPTRVETVFTNSLRNVPEADDFAADLWRKGVRNPDEFNRQFAEAFPSLGAKVDKKNYRRCS